MEESPETVGVGSLVGGLEFPWEGDSNEGGKTFLLQQSAAEKTELFSQPSRLRVTSGLHRFEKSGRRSSGRLVPKSLLAQAANTAALPPCTLR